MCGAASARMVVCSSPTSLINHLKFKIRDQPLGQPRFRSSNARVDFRFMSVPSVIVLSLFCVIHARQTLKCSELEFQERRYLYHHTGGSGVVL